MAEFHTPEDLVAAAERAAEKGYSKFDAFSPFPVEGLDDVVPNRGPYLPLIVLIGGIIGCAIGFGMQYYVSVMYYPMNVGGRPFNSWPSFIPVTFELTVLCAALTAVFGMLGLNGLPMPYHPVFNVPRFALASNDRFFLCIEAEDPKFTADDTRRFLESVNGEHIAEVHH
jgi:hypothetical protein